MSTRTTSQKQVPAAPTGRRAQRHETQSGRSLTLANSLTRPLLDPCAPKLRRSGAARGVPYGPPVDLFSEGLSAVVAIVAPPTAGPSLYSAVSPFRGAALLVPALRNHCLSAPRGSPRGGAIVAPRAAKTQRPSFPRGSCLAGARRSHPRRGAAPNATGAVPGIVPGASALSGGGPKNRAAPWRSCRRAALFGGLRPCGQSFGGAGRGRAPVVPSVLFPGPRKTTASTRAGRGVTPARSPFLTPHRVVGSVPRPRAVLHTHPIPSLYTLSTFCSHFLHIP